MFDGDIDRDGSTATEWVLVAGVALGAAFVGFVVGLKVGGASSNATAPSGPVDTAASVRKGAAVDTAESKEGVGSDATAAEGDLLDRGRYRDVVDLRELRRDGQLEALERVDVETYDDPAYGGDQTFRGWRVREIVEEYLDLPENDDGWVVRFVATDGYKASVPLAELRAMRPGGVVAFRQLGIPGNADWRPFPDGDQSATPAPFYLVWPKQGESGAHRPWVYKLAALGVARETDLWGAAFPDHDESLRSGFVVFRDHCMRCHSMNLAGGGVGPELNVPRNVTKYWRPAELPDYIRNPRDYRADAEMPAMNAELTNAEMDALMNYLRGMRQARVCESARSCREYAESD